MEVKTLIIFVIVLHHKAKRLKSYNMQVIVHLELNLIIIKLCLRDTNSKQTIQTEIDKVTLIKFAKTSNQRTKLQVGRNSVNLPNS